MRLVRYVKANRRRLEKFIPLRFTDDPDAFKMVCPEGLAGIPIA